jgi:hypothetical protein
MSSKDTNDHTTKRKATEVPDVVVSSEDKGPKETKARRVGQDASSLNTASSDTAALVKTETGVATANATSVSDAKQGTSLMTKARQVSEDASSPNAASSNADVPVKTENGTSPMAKARRVSEDASSPNAASSNADVPVKTENGTSPMSKARRVSEDASSPNAASSNADVPVKTENDSIANAPSASNAAPEESLESIGALIQDLFCSDNVKVKASLDALFLNLDGNKTKSDKIVTLGGCHALVQLMKNCLEKAIEKIPACDQVTELDELAELEAIEKALNVITNLAYQHGARRISITAIGGVEAAVKVMKTFPKCRDVQWSASCALINLAPGNIIGKNKAVKMGGIKVLLAAVNNHLDSAIVCEKACWALRIIVFGSKENTGILISLSGTAAVAKVRAKWSDNGNVQKQVRKLANLIAAKVQTWAHEK